MEGQHLTEEQEAMRLRGLRILARIIVRAHLSSLANGEGGLNDGVSGNDADDSARAKEDKNAA